jgi:hypothetical protein
MQESPPQPVAPAPNPAEAAAEAATEPPTEREGRRPAAGFWREVAGALAIGLVVLAAAVLVFQIVAMMTAIPGPGLGTVAGHMGAAAVAMLAQRVADRRAGWLGVAAVVTVLIVTGGTLWIFWWA